jgi:hypothetical protein
VNIVSKPGYSLRGLYNNAVIETNDGMINACGAVGGMRIDRANRSTLGGNPSQRHFVCHTSHMSN